MAHRVVLSDGWRFGEVPEEVPKADWAGAGADEAGWAEVSLPHCVAPLSWRDWDPATWERTFCYRRHFAPPEAFAGLRAFVDIDGAMTKATVALNGHQLGVHLGGYLPFSYEVTDYLAEGENVLAILLDARFDINVPPNLPAPGTHDDIDYFEPGGIYREVSLRAVPQIFIDDVFAKPVDVLSGSPRLELECTIDSAVVPEGAGLLSVEVMDPGTGQRVGSAVVAPQLSSVGRTVVRLSIDQLSGITLWDLERPQLYDVVSTLVWNGQALHEHRARTGFQGGPLRAERLFPERAAGEAVRRQPPPAFPLHRLRHGRARPAPGRRGPAPRAQLQHGALFALPPVPGLPGRLRRARPVGLGGARRLAVPGRPRLEGTGLPGRRRDGPARPQPALHRALGPRLNETADDTELYTRTDKIAKDLDGSRQTAGATHGPYYLTQDYQHDVFGYDDYTTYTDGQARYPFLLPPRTDRPYLISESLSWRSSETRTYTRRDPVAVQQIQALAHAMAHNKVAGDPAYAGLLCWSGFDYYSTFRFHHQSLKVSGLADIFRIPKPGAAIYRSQVDPRRRPVIEPAFYFDLGPASPQGPGGQAMVCSNCERVEAYLDNEHVATLWPDRHRFAYLAYPPSFIDLVISSGRPELRLDGYLGQHLAISRCFASATDGDQLYFQADDTELVADGVDLTRAVFAAVDRFGAPRPFVGGEVTFVLDGPGVLIGDNPFAFADAGGAGAVWARTVAGQTGEIHLRATHPSLGTAEVVVKVEEGGVPGQLRPDMYARKERRTALPQ